MKKYKRYSARASLVIVGLYMKQLQIWKTVEQELQIKQKTVKHRPIEKVLDALINILAGGQGIVEVNTRVRTDKALQRAFGRKRCAEQSTISETLNACTEENVAQMRKALRMIYQTKSIGHKHDYENGYQVIDVDMTGMVAGRKAEQATKGFFSGKRNRRGRQLGRVLASLYDEIVYEKLYPGTVQLEQSLQELVLEVESVLDMDKKRRKKTIMRVDGGGGRDEDVNWLLARDYQIVTKVKNWKRAYKLAKSVTCWFPDPKVPDRDLGWVEAPHPYCRTTRQLAMRWPKGQNSWHYRVLVFSLSDAMLFELIRRPMPADLSNKQLLSAVVDAYDLRGGGVETAIRNSKQGLGLTKRNKRSFSAQEILVLLAQLAYNLLVWVRNLLVFFCPDFEHFGMLRLLRDVFHISGKVLFDKKGYILSVRLNKDHHLALPVYKAFHSYLARDGTQLILGKIKVSGFYDKNVAAPVEDLPILLFKLKITHHPGIDRFDDLLDIAVGHKFRNQPCIELDYKFFILSSPMTCGWVRLWAI